MFTLYRNAILRNGKDHTLLLAIAYRRTKATRDADAFWIIPGTLDLNA